MGIWKWLFGKEEKAETLDYHKGVFALAKGDYPQAIASLSKAIRSDPGDGMAYYHRALAYKGQAQYEEAIADLTEAIRLKPEWDALFNYRGSAYFERGDYPKAIEDFSHAIELDPELISTPDYLQARARAYRALGDEGNAASDERRAQEVRDQAQKAQAARLPVPEQVARRAMTLSLVVFRASLEDFPGDAQSKALHSRLPAWVHALGLTSELEEQEHHFLLLPLGKADQRIVWNAAWRTEGLGVLAWALTRFELPSYDEPVDIIEAARSIGFTTDLLSAMDTTPAQELLHHAKLRPASEIDRFATHITIVRSRLIKFGVGPVPTINFDPKPMDFAGNLRAHPRFEEIWLNDLRLIKGDLAIADKPIAAASLEDVRKCSSMALERQIAASWLQGDDPNYSKVMTGTVF